MKRLLILLLMLLACSSAQARIFSYGLFIHRVNDQVKVDVYAPFGETVWGFLFPKPSPS